MLRDFEKAMCVMTELFSKDCQLAMATTAENMPSVRFVDTYFDGAYFYIVTSSESQKVKDISRNSSVALCSNKMFRFCCKAVNIGHPLAPENQRIRERLTAVFSDWYFLHNDENNKNMCYLKLIPINGFFHKDGLGYQIDFSEKSAEIFPFSFSPITIG